MDKQCLKIEKIPITRTEVFEKLYSAIISGYFKPGERLVERDLSKILGVSRTPIREVLRELERLNLVKSEPYKGVFVNTVTIKEANDIFVLRNNIEGLAIKLCVENITKTDLNNMKNNLILYKKAQNSGDLQRLLQLDDEFHSIIYKSTDNNVLINTIQNLRTMIGHYRERSLPIRQQETYAEHENIYLAIKEKNIQKAETAIQKHINSFWLEIKHQFSENK